MEPCIIAPRTSSCDCYESAFYAVGSITWIIVFYIVGIVFEVLFHIHTIVSYLLYSVQLNFLDIST